MTQPQPAKHAVIIGAGPAGLTAAFELLQKTDIVPLVFEASDVLGGISQTFHYKGNRLDLGGHRFFSKSDRVMQWWLERLPRQASAPRRHQGGGAPPPVAVPDPETTDEVMLVRSRKSRIYFLRRFFDYPLRLNAATVLNLGLVRMVRIGVSYLLAMLTATRHPKNLEEFFIGRFGRELYRTFFKSYTEKVWGESCSNISAEWGAQRVKGLSISKALLHLLKSLAGTKDRDLSQKDTETSLIEEFLYPKFGPGQMWETVAGQIVRRGAKLLLRHRVTKLHAEGNRIVAVDATDLQTGQVTTYPADYVFSTMPVRELIESLDAPVPAEVREVANGLVYRDFITVGLLVKKLKVTEKDAAGQPRPVSDNWIYIQEPDVKLGRLQIFNNWSPYMVADPQTTWLGLEYFCYESDELWNLADGDMIALARRELAEIGIIESGDVLDAAVLRMPKTYPAYFGTYDRFPEIRNYVDAFENLFLVGRNGMHKYNNQDHSMLTAMTAVDNLAAGRTDKANIWDVNTEQDYHEARTPQNPAGAAGDC